MTGGRVTYWPLFDHFYFNEKNTKTEKEKKNQFRSDQVKETRSSVNLGSYLSTGHCVPCSENVVQRKLVPPRPGKREHF